MKYLLLACLLCVATLPSVSAKDAPVPPVPIEMSLSIGGFFGGSYRVELKGREVHYFSRKDGKEVETVITPTAEQWAAFRNSLDELSIWDWRKKYNSSAVDGTQWSVAIAYKGKKLLSSGSNQYPGRAARGFSDYTPEFEKYLAAVKKLVGGREFR